MMVHRTVKAKIFGLTRVKEALLREEYDNFQAYLRGFDVPLYSATKQQAQRLLRRLKGKLKRKEYSMILRRDVFNIKVTGNKLSQFWVKIPIHHVKGGIKAPIQLPHNQEELLSSDIREGNVLWKRNHWSLHLTVMKKVQLKSEPPSTILAVDLGERHIATSVEYANGVMKNPRFYGTEVRGIRRHYAWLRNRLGKRKLLQAIRKIGHTERRKVNAILHKISRNIVEEAKESAAVIVLGDLKGIRQKKRGKRLNRIISNMPYFRLTKMITYKAQWEGIPICLIKENNTSKLCHRCGSEGKRPAQGLFQCPACELEYNADLNGAINLAKRFSEQSLGNGAVFDKAYTLGR
jgi:putative transposase